MQIEKILQGKDQIESIETLSAESLSHPILRKVVEERVLNEND